MKMGRPKSGDDRGLVLHKVQKWRGQKEPVPVSEIAKRCGVTRQAAYQFMRRNGIK